MKRGPARITRHRRRARGYEALPTHHEATAHWAMVRITSSRHPDLKSRYGF
ncbi:hypothetical protein GCM10023322_51940 [Rugosimonospora acidiphila]|uniref:Transposase n=1 Tax=Rugosimonospora acidiphila TaxID=556531 RepID=A0ABP9SAG3_9ACTN